MNIAGMKIILFGIGALVGSAVVHVLDVPLWMAGPVMGLYIWWFMADERELEGW
jgi:hypothetical protein